ncbi:unnamed protein product [Phytomonas sp. EM1]|nr:unnamed protein product [Phytomonas sp. EM1]|eukprot:CCW65866.1 unnamed protein product [Phytomonas sp. isolate EM1]
MWQEFWVLVIFIISLFLLHHYVAPLLFPMAIHRIGVIKIDKISDQLFLYQSGSVPSIVSNNGLRRKANVRRRKLPYEAAQV